MINSLNTLCGSDIYPFHMPGHKRQSDGSWLGEINKYDITEIDGFDNLQHPEGIIADIEKGYADHYGVRKAHLLVNGSTCGILSSIATVNPHRSMLLMDRGAHQSAFNAVYLGELSSHYLKREILPFFDIPLGISPEEVEKAIYELERSGKLPKAVFITSPTYEGFISDIDSIAKIVHTYNIPLIVDGAHGASLKVSENADITVVSLHKTLPALTQLGLVLVNGDLINDDELKKYINIFQTSSPSYILMASAEKCLTFMQKELKTRSKILSDELEKVYRLNGELKNLRLIGPDLIGKYGVFSYDKSKINLVGCNEKNSGKRIYDRLRTDYKIQPEMYMGYDCLLMASVMDTGIGFTRLMDAIKAIDEES
ncbi:MAG: DegT/DnrJ/EryC1/StrS family aminotransferase [Lachnospiraceae bacterium]|nr:DegT/DnrJ/EryC1/StrS family aminotransferase [Lachnospiraceae bacterium]